MVDMKLNLTRKWRAKNFDQIVGQDLSIRMLKNSLYLGHYFPVYLFSGKHGCGKTTTARVFAMAINCQILENFQKDPKINSLPCLSCTSCKAMLSGKHPDFIEIDAASHTGVDNIRQIIDAASFLPLMGKKKLYLIDEAHMLSKAAFNALLKLLEEPPASVLFILATTDPQKIIETVKSRCFQLLFKAIDTPVLFNHMKKICKAEGIETDEAALKLIIHETQGSARDALNLIEQVRFSSNTVTKDAVLQLLGHLDNARLIHIMQLVIERDAKALILFLQKISFERFAAEFMWRRFIQIIRTFLWLKYGVDSTTNIFSVHAKLLRKLAQCCSVARFNSMLELLYQNEQVFLKTTAQHIFLEIILLQLCQQNTSDNSDGTPSLSQQQQVSKIAVDDSVMEDEGEDEYEDDVLLSLWKQFLTAIEGQRDPLLTSIFSQGTCIQFNKKTKILDVEFAKDLSFFESILCDERATWLPYLHNIFGESTSINPLFIGKKTEVKAIRFDAKKQQGLNLVSKEQKVTKHNNGKKWMTSVKKNVSSRYNSPSTSIFRGDESAIDISDTSTWQKTNLVLSYFPGSVKEVRE